MKSQRPVAVVTGAGRGIGQHLALHLATGGWKVYGVVHELTLDLTSVAKGNPRWIEGDVADTPATKGIINEIIQREGAISGLVNNAAINATGLLENVTEEDWDRMVAVNLKGYFNFMAAVLPNMKRQGYGSIVNIASVNGIRGREGSGPYCATKAGILGLTKAAAREAGPAEIRVNAVAPGFILTGGQEKTSELIKKLVLQECAIPRLGRMEDVAELVHFLLSDKSTYITGQVIQVDGGQWV